MDSENSSRSVTSVPYVDPKKVLTDAKAAVEAARANAQKRIDKLDADHESETKRYRDEKAALQALLRTREFKTRGPNKVKAGTSEAVAS